MPTEYKNLSFSGKSFSGQRLVNVRYIDCDFTKADFTDQDLISVYFHGTSPRKRMNMHGAIFVDAELRYGMFANVDLRGANLTNATLTRVKFINADLRGVVFDSPPDINKLSVTADDKTLGFVELKARIAVWEALPQFLASQHIKPPAEVPLQDIQKAVDALFSTMLIGGSRRKVEMLEACKADLGSLGFNKSHLVVLEKLFAAKLKEQGKGGFSAEL